MRVLASPTDYHHVFVIPIDGNQLDLYDGSSWVPTLVTQQDIDVFNCTVEGVPNQHIPFDVDLRIYAYRDSIGNMQVNFSTSPEIAHLASGYQIRTASLGVGDPYNRLIGGCHYCSVGGTFSGGQLVPGTNELGFGVGSRYGGLGANNNNVGSYFNSLCLNPSVPLGSGSNSDAVVSRITTDFNRITLWLWGDARECLIMASGSCTGNTANVPVYVGIGENGNTPDRYCTFIPAFANQVVPFSVISACNANGEGLNTFDLWIRTGVAGATASIVAPTVFCARYVG